MSVGHIIGKKVAIAIYGPDLTSQHFEIGVVADQRVVNMVANSYLAIVVYSDGDKCYMEIYREGKPVDKSAFSNIYFYGSIESLRKRSVEDSVGCLDLAKS